MFVISKKETVPSGMDLKIYNKSIGWPIWIFILCEIHLGFVSLIGCSHGLAWFAVLLRCPGGPLVGIVGALVGLPG